MKNTMLREPFRLVLQVGHLQESPVEMEKMLLFLVGAYQAARD